LYDQNLYYLATERFIDHKPSTISWSSAFLYFVCKCYMLEHSRYFCFIGICEAYVKLYISVDHGWGTSFCFKNK